MIHERNNGQTKVHLKVTNCAYERQCQENEKICHKWKKHIFKHIFDKRLLSKIYQELLKFSYKKTNNLIKK